MLAGRGASPTRRSSRSPPTTSAPPPTCSVPSTTRPSGVDGRVSIEVSPDLAHDTEATIAEAKKLWATVDRPNVLIKIPATKAGLPAITAVDRRGHLVNVTLIFSLERYAEVIDAYLAGLEQAQAAGHDLSTIHSVASFFVSRVDTEVDKRLTRSAPRGRGAQEQGRRRERPAGLRAVRAGVRHRPREGAARRRRQRAAPAVGLDRRQGPRASRHPLRHRARRPRHGQHDAGEDARGHLRPRRDRGRHRHRRLRRRARVFDPLAAVGVDFDDVTQVLEDEGVDKFIASWHELQETVADRARGRRMEAARELRRSTSGRVKSVVDATSRPITDLVASGITAGDARCGVPTAEEEASKRLGWVQAVTVSRPLVPRSRRFAPSWSARASPGSSSRAWAARRSPPRSSRRPPACRS